MKVSSMGDMEREVTLSKKNERERKCEFDETGRRRRGRGREGNEQL